MLVASDNGSLTVPASINVAAGSTSTTFAATAIAVTTQTVAQVSITYNGVAKSFGITLAPPSSLSLSSLSCSPSTVIGGAASQCTVSLAASAPAGGTVVTLASSNSAVRVPASVTVAAGASAASFQATSSAVSSSLSVTITASQGASTRNTVVTVSPVLLSLLTCTPRSIDPGQSTQCELTLNGAALADVAIRLSSSSNLTTPNSVTMRTGQTAVTFVATAKPQARAGAVTITATLNTSSVQTTINILSRTTPSLAAPSNLTSIGRERVKFRVTAWDPGDLPLTVSASRLPAGARFDSTTGEFEWEPDGVPEGSYAIPITATNSAGQSSTETVTVDVRSEQPVLEKLLNTATRATEGACSPGSRATLIGAGLSEAGLLLNGESVDIVRASQSEIDFVCPELVPGTALDLQVRRGSASSTVLHANAAEPVPAIFSLDGSGAGQAIALLGDSSTVVMQRSPGLPSQPAVRTDAVRLIVTGLSTHEIQVLVGGNVAKVSSIEKMAAGLWSIGFEIPEAAPLGNAVPVMLELTLPYGKVVGSNVTTIAIEPRSETDH
jgi:uncharacterized protein (TIGR03437 family)